MYSQYQFKSTVASIETTISELKLLLVGVEALILLKNV